MFTNIGLSQKNNLKKERLEKFTVLHIIKGKANKNRANGVNQVIDGICKYSARSGIRVNVIGMAKTASFEGEEIFKYGYTVRVFTNWMGGFYRALFDEIYKADIIHLHGTYSLLNIFSGWACERVGKPYMVTLHGGLSPARNTWRNSFKKWIFHQFLQKRHLENAAFIQCLTEEETTEAVMKFCPQSIVVIPNGVDLDDFPRTERIMKNNSIKSIGYIGRISHEKNLESLCSAFSKINKDHNMQLLLAGPLTDEAKRIERRWSSYNIKIVGPKFGLDKTIFLDSLNVFVHPSKTDVFSIGAMEALACGVPVIITRTSDTSYFLDTGAFIMCEPTAYGIEKALWKALNSQETLAEMASRGRQLIETKLNWNIATSNLIEAYRDVTKL